MPNLADLQAQELAQFNHHMNETKRLIRQLARFVEAIEAHLVNQSEAGINSLKPDDFAARGNYLTSDVNSLTNNDWNRAHRVLEDVYAFLNEGNNIDGAAHTENYTDAARAGILLNIPRFNYN